jgi:hypothetical protein
MKRAEFMASLNKIMFLLLCLIFAAYSISLSESENYCHNQESWKEWDALVEKNPYDTEVQALHALRIGLCAKVDKGQITLEQATDIFESAREAIIRKRKDDQQRKKNEKKL